MYRVCKNISFNVTRIWNFEFCIQAYLRNVLDELKLEFWSVQLGFHHLQVNPYCLQNGEWYAFVHLYNLLLLLIHIPFTVSFFSCSQVYRSFNSIPGKIKKSEHIIAQKHDVRLHSLLTEEDRFAYSVFLSWSQLWEQQEIWLTGMQMIAYNLAIVNPLPDGGKGKEKGML